MKNNQEFEIKTAGHGEVDIIRKLAYDIWPDAYGTILSSEQLSYMLELIYSESALRQQMNEGQEFLLLLRDTIPIGFAAWSPYGSPGEYKLHKLYVRTDIQGKGLGKRLLQVVWDKIGQLGGGILYLNVNRYNKARSFYEKLGFEIDHEADIPIGNGYFMNDYIMRKDIPGIVQA